MLHLILGRAGSGKTELAVNIAKKYAAENIKTLFVVPEQFTFETEKLILHRLGPKSCLNIEILSFTRLAYRVFSEVGGLAYHYVDECGRYVVMARALKQVEDQLTVYRRQAKSASFIKLMVDSVSEYKTCGVSGGALKEAARKVSDGVLKSKLHDVSIILQTYDALLHEKFADSLDDLDRLSQSLVSRSFFADKAVIIDSFYGFTAPETKVIQTMIKQSPDVTVTLCADKLEDEEHGIGLFSGVKKTANALIRTAQKNSVRVAPPVVLGETKRMEPKCLRALEKNLFRYNEPMDAGPADAIHISLAKDIYKEVQYIASEIKKLILEKACRYGDIAVIVGGLADYRPVLEPVFRKYGIPLYIDARKPVSSHPLMVTVSSFLALSGGDFSHENIFRFLKTGLAGFKTEEIAVLENYALMWDIHGRAAWKNEWASNPRGMGYEFDDKAAEELAAVNALRQKVLAPVNEFASVVHGDATGAELAAALYRSLCAAGIPDRIDRLQNELSLQGELDLADEYGRIWDILIKILDQLALASGERKIKIDEFAKLFDLIVKNYEFGHIQPSIDCVSAGSYERIRAGEKKYVFAAGLADGIFPSGNRGGGVFSDLEINHLEQCGLEFLKSSQEKSVEERFFAYKALTSAKNGLFISCPKSDLSGKPLRPSYYLNAVQAAVPGCPVTGALEDTLDAVQNEQSAFETLAEHFQDTGQLYTALRTYFKDTGGLEYRAKMEALKIASKRSDFKIADPSLPGRLFGSTLRISPSMAETHRQCRFAFFCRYGVHAAPREKAELSAPQAGTLVHYVLEKYFADKKLLPGQAGMDSINSTASQEIKKILEEYADRFLGGLKNKTERFRYLYSRLTEMVTELVIHLLREFSQSEFRPADFELEISDKGPIKPMIVRMPDGGRLYIEGKVDRVDVLKKGRNTYLRVIDYKTGVKQFSLSDILNGLNMQMLIYLFALCQNGGERYCGETGHPIPAGVLYMPARQANIQGGRDEEPTSVEKEKAKKYRMNGLILSEPEVAAGMEKEGAGLYIPAKFKVQRDENGNIVSCGFNPLSSIASLEELGYIEKHVEKVLQKMGKMIADGDIAAVPVNGNGYNPCTYCYYMAVCGHAPNDRVDLLANYDKKQAWEQLEREAGPKKPEKDG